MQGFLIYLLGWLVFIICHFIYFMYFVKDGSFTKKLSNEKNKKLILYNGFKWGIFSWFGLFCSVTVILIGYIIYFIIQIDEWIEGKLKD